jgi:Zn-dependent protease
MGDTGLTLSTLLVVAIPAIVAITFHEAAHGYVAWKLGDPTAHSLGRVTFNPIRHLDLVGTILIPGILLASRAGFLFGWAKPVPIDPSKLANPRWGMVLVAAAGPGINFGLALVSGVLLSASAALGAGDGAVAQALSASIYINAILAVFNMIPLPPLDGGRVAVGLLPAPMAYRLAQLEDYGLYLIVAVLFLLPIVTRGLGVEIDPFGSVIRPIVLGVVEIVEAVTGARMVWGW